MPLKEFLELNMRKFIPIEDLARDLDIPAKNILNLFSRDKKVGRDDRFIFKDGKVLVHQNYKCPHYDDICKLYYSALIVAQNEKEVARFIADRTGKSEQSVYFYFRNFKFKNPDFARVVIKLLKIFIKQNSLFGELDYE